MFFRPDGITLLRAPQATHDVRRRVIQFGLKTLFIKLCDMSRIVCCFDVTIDTCLFLNSFLLFFSNYNKLLHYLISTPRNKSVITFQGRSIESYQPG
jgi:hypothetical protein